MTTIAWKGRTLAADTQLTYEDATKAFCRKITFFGDFQVVAVAGDVESEYYFKRWLQAGGKIDTWGNNVIEFLKKPKFEALYVDKRKQIWYYTDGPAPMLIEHKFAAIGSGRSLALAAMHMGLSAKDAVLLAGDIDINTNKVVDTYDIQTGKLTLRKPPASMVQASKEG